MAKFVASRFGLKVRKVTKEKYNEIQEAKKKKIEGRELAKREFRNPDNH